MIVKIINHSRHPMPAYETALSAGMDIRANLDQDIVVSALQRVVVPTGLFISIPPGYEAQVRPRSGLAARDGVTVLNTPGTIDADYRGEVKVILVNLSDKDFIIHDGDRIAQMVISSHERVEWEPSTNLDETSRGQGGFGHTGKH